MALCAWLSTRTGEDQEETVARVVDEEHIEVHEEMGERVLLLAGITLVLAASGLAPGKIGLIGRVLAAGSTVVLLFATLQTGHSGGELVYRHGAADAYVHRGNPEDG